jgi:DHA2 family multidrug resistance protein
MVFVFVPLTTATHDPIAKEQMGNATSIFNVMRNIGGSIGIASVTTIVARAAQTNIRVLGAQITPYNPGVRSMMKGTTGLFASRGGSSLPTATNQAYGAMFGMVQQQAAMLANIHAFRLLSLIFLACIPLILLMHRSRHHGGTESGVH